MESKVQKPIPSNRKGEVAEGLPGNWQSYRDQLAFDANDGDVQFPRARANTNTQSRMLSAKSRQKCELVSAGLSFQKHAPFKVNGY
jgi:hypothetical protein